MRFSRCRVAACLSTTALLVASTAVGAGPALAESGCDPVAIVTFRGSGEKNLDPSAGTLAGTDHRYGSSALTTNGWEGARLSRLFDAYVETPRRSSWPSGFSPDLVPVLSIGYDGSAGYPAVPAEAKISIFGDLITSSNAGASHAAAVIGDFVAAEPPGCDTTFIAVGFSQGAMAARTLALGAPERVGGVIGLGDPFQMPNGAGNEGAAADGEGIVRWWEGKANRAITDAFYGLAAHKSALCHDRDPMCSYSWLFGLAALKTAVGPHLDYLEVGTEASDKAAELADLAARLSVETPETPAPRAALDTVFVVDTTGSMGPYISSARETASAAAAAIFGSATRGRVGLVEYRDHGDAFVARQVVPLTNSSDAFSAGLAGLRAGGGGSWPEAVCSGILEAARADWDPTASRSIVLIADARAHDPERVTGHTLAQVGEVLAGRLPVPPRTMEAPAPAAVPLRAASAAVVPAGLPVSLYVITSDDELAAQTAGIVAATGGRSFSIDDPSELAGQILDSVEDATSAPEARLHAAGVSVTGLPLVFSALDSITHPGAAGYDFDLDGDGAFEAVDAGPSVAAVFAAAGRHTVSVRVTDDRGRSAGASIEVEVADRASTVRALPNPEDASTRLTGVAVSSRWTSVADPATLTVGDALRHDEQVGARLVAAGGTDTGAWSAGPASVFGPAVAGAGARMLSLVPSDLPDGDYTLLVFTDLGRHATAPITVVSRGPATPPPSAPPSAPPSVPPQGPAPGPGPDPGPDPVPGPVPDAGPDPVTAPGPAPGPPAAHAAGASPTANLAASGFDGAAPAGLAALLLTGGLAVFAWRRARARR